MNSGPTVLDWATLGIACGGLALAVLSLGWQIISWTYSGARVKVHVGFAFLNLGPGAEPTSALYVEASNRGRAACEVTSWGLEIQGRGRFFARDPVAESSPTPTTIDGLHRAQWFVRVVEFAHPDLLSDEWIRVVGFVNLGDGKTVRAKRAYSLDREIVLNLARGDS